MKTIEILLQFIKAIQTNPAILYQIPWEDLKLCIATELEYRCELYPPSQYEEIQQLLENRFQTINDLLTIPDATAISGILNEFVTALQMLPTADHAEATIQQANYNEACLNHYKNDTIIVLGDSHVNFFSGNELLTFHSIGNDINVCPTITSNPFTVLHLGPCLAYNCNRTGTSTQFQEKLTYLCDNFIKPGARILFCLGEIDLRVHVFPQTKLQNKPYQAIVDNILAEYIPFLISLKEKGYQVACWGPIASQQEICPIDPDFPRNGSETERNMATAYFNNQLESLCRQHQIGYLSIFDRMVTPDFQTMGEYLSSDHCHLSQRAAALAQPLIDQLFNA